MHYTNSHLPYSHYLLLGIHSYTLHMPINVLYRLVLTQKNNLAYILLLNTENDTHGRQVSYCQSATLNKNIQVNLIDNQATLSSEQSVKTTKLFLINKYQRRTYIKSAYTCNYYSQITT